MLAMCWLANVIYLLAAAAYLPVLVYQMLFQTKNRRGWRQRLGHWPIAPSDRPQIWVHAVSLGEMNAAAGLIQQLERELPGFDVVISTTTDTGFARGVKLYGADRVFRFPLDFSWVINRALNRTKPQLIVLMELEVWYNLIHLAHRRGIPVVVVNGRLTERSFGRFKLLGPLARSMFRRLTWVGAQDEPIAQRFWSLGLPPERLTITGSMKWDTALVADTVEGAEPLARALALDRSVPLWVAGSTGGGEEGPVLDAYALLLQRGVQQQLAIVPRKPERFDEVAELIRRRGYSCHRRSEHPDHQPVTTTTDKPAKDRPVILGDTMGELRKFYSLAAMVYVGRSLVSIGGSDPMEVAALAKPLIAGPHMHNFAAPVAALKHAGVLDTIHNPDELAEAIAALLSNPSATIARGRKAQQVVRDHQGSTTRTVEQLCRLLGVKSPSPSRQTVHDVAQVF